MPDKKTLSYYTAELRRIEESRQADTEKEVNKIYKELLTDLNSFLGNEYAAYSDGNGILSVAVLQEKARYAKFLQEVDKHLNSITPQVSKTIRTTVEDTYNAVYTGMVDAVTKSVDNEELKEKLKGLSLRPEVMKNAIENPISGLTLPDTLEKHRKEVIYNIKQQINIGLMTGERYDTMAKNVKKVISGDNGTGGSYGKAMNIVRTESHRVQESGFMDSAEDVSKGLEGSGLVYVAIWRTRGDKKVRPSYRIHTPKGWKTKIAKTTANHQKMEGKIAKVGDKFELEPGVFAKCPGSSGTARNDCNCRCYLEYELMTYEEFAKATGKTVAEVKKGTEVVEKDKGKAFTKADDGGIINLLNNEKIKIDLGSFREDNKKSVLKNIEAGNIDKKEFYSNYHYFTKNFKNGIITPIGNVEDSNDSYWHIIDRHPYMMSKEKTNKIIECLISPDSIYKTRDKFGISAKCYVVENDSKPLLVIVRNELVTAYEPKDSYLKKIIREGELIWKKQ